MGSYPDPETTKIFARLGVLEEQKAAREKELREARYSGYSRRRTLTISFVDGRTLRVECFSEAFAHAEIIDEIPEDFDLRMRCGDIDLWIRTDPYSGLTVTASPQENEAVRDLYGDVKGWLKTIRTSKWWRAWRGAASASFLLWLIWFGISSQILTNSFYGPTDYKTVARQLIEKGITAANRDQVLQAILAMEAGYAGPEKFHVGLGAWVFIVGGFLVCLVLTFAPKIVIGIGKGEQFVSWWKVWAKVVFVVIPLFVVANILAPLLVALISKRIGL